MTINLPTSFTIGSGWLLAIAIISTLCATAWSYIVFMGNGMSDNPTAPFEGGGSMVFGWLFAIAFWALWFFGR